MRWKQKHPKSGTLKIIIRFLFLPKIIAGETRWLEKATWERKYTHSTLIDYGCWRDTRWMD